MIWYKLLSFVDYVDKRNVVNTVNEQLLQQRFTPLSQFLGKNFGKPVKNPNYFMQDFPGQNFSAL